MTIKWLVWTEVTFRT